MWIEAESQHYLVINSKFVEQLYVRYRGNGAYAAIAITSQGEIQIQSAADERTITEYVKKLAKDIKEEKQ